MAVKKSEVYVFSHLSRIDEHRDELRDGRRFVPSGILGLTETDGANLQNRGLASEFAYGTGYLGRKESFEIDPVSLAFGEESLFDKLDLLCKTLGASYERVDEKIVFSSSGCQSE